jgi:hypothetical protein
MVDLLMTQAALRARSCWRRCIWAPEQSWVRERAMVRLPTVGWWRLTAITGHVSAFPLICEHTFLAWSHINSWALWNSSACMHWKTAVTHSRPSLRCLFLYTWSHPWWGNWASECTRTFRFIRLDLLCWNYYMLPCTCSHYWSARLTVVTMKNYWSRLICARYWCRYYSRDRGEAEIGK